MPVCVVRRALLLAVLATGAWACSSSSSGPIFGDEDADGGGNVRFGPGETTNGSSSEPEGSGSGGGPEPECDPDAEEPDCSEPTPHCAAARVCVECLVDDHCAGEAICENSACVSPDCEPGTRECSGDTLLTCRDDGQGWRSFPCVNSECTDGACRGCPAGETVCRGQRDILRCEEQEGGTRLVEATSCAEDEVCVEGDCLSCRPGDRRCDGSVAQRCTDAGEWTTVEDCAPSGRSCAAGNCISPCATDPKLKTNSGCDYWAVDMDNHADAQDSPYAVIVSNLGEEASEVTISRTEGADDVEQVAEATVEPGGLEPFMLPQSHPGGPELGWGAFRIQSTSPIIAYQFNPLDNVDVFSNDASLLMPTNTYGTEYVVMSRQQLRGGIDGPEGAGCETVCSQFDDGECQTGPEGQQVCVAPYRGTISVVARADETEVTVKPTTRTEAGDGVPAIPAYEPETFELDGGQVLHLASDQNPEVDGEGGGDLTGTLVTSNRPVAVFGGHEAAVSAERCCADHLEEQLFPVKTWGKRYVATKSVRRAEEPDYWRVVAAKDDTTVSFEPAVASEQTLHRGQWIEVATDEDFVVEADEPVMVGHYLASSNDILTTEAGATCTSDEECHEGYACTAAQCVPPFCEESQEGTGQGCPDGHTCACRDDGPGSTCTCEPIGDPSLMLTPPQGQFREEYVFSIPSKYRDDYVNIIAPAGTSVSVDGETVSADEFESVGTSDFVVARMPIADGVHRVEADAGVGVVAYAYDDDVSYGYTAGLNLNDI